MNIQEIKSRLSIAEVLSYYSLKPNKNKMLNCPFHEDKTPSMMIYEGTDTVYCFSSNCQLHGKSIDQIDFILYKENISKKEAIEKAKQIAGIIEQPKETNLEKTFEILKKNLHKSINAKQYLKDRKIYDLKIEAGFNRKTIKELKECVIFPLKDKEGKIVSMYGRSINKKYGTHYYTKNRQGLYPNYPCSDIKILVLTESILDAATIKMHTEYEVLALYGTNGLNIEHKEAISSLPKLEEIVFFMDGDELGNKSTEKYSREIRKIYPNITISKVETPEEEDPNSLIQSHEKEILNHLIDIRQIIYNPESKKVYQNEIYLPNKYSKLNTKDSNYLKYNDKSIQITILGGINLFPIDKLKVTLKLQKPGSYNPLYNIRHSLDLYNDDQTEKLIKKSSERLEISNKDLQITISELIIELEEYRKEQIELQKPKKTEKRLVPQKRIKAAIDWLKKQKLLERTNKLIGESGVIGEETNRLLMYLIFTSRLREQPLHIISLGASGTGKTYLQEKISELIPEEQKIEITTLSENALYYFERTELKNKLVLIEDLDGANDDKVLYAIRELMSKKRISKTIPIKDSQGNLKTITLQVEGPISLSGTTTREKLYEDNANRSILIYLDNSKTHKENIMDYQRILSAGEINHQKEEEIKEFFKDIQTVLKPIKIKNPYAKKLIIPETVFKPLRTNTHYLSFIEIVTFYKQYQRKKFLDENGQEYIKTTLEDIKEANELLKDVLLAKSDELSKTCRNFLETIKSYLKKEEKTTFYRSEIRDYLRINPHNIRHYLFQLYQYGYIKIIGGNKYKQGYEYELTKKEEYVKLKEKVNNALDLALEKIKSAANAVNSCEPIQLATQVTVNQEVKSSC